MGRLTTRGPSKKPRSDVSALDRFAGTVSHVAVVESPIWDSGATVADPGLLSESSTQREKGWIVTVYDNDTNTHLEVISILMVATGCDAEEASIETWEIDNLGSSVVHCDSESACQDAAKVIATIGIRVEATPDPLA